MLWFNIISISRCVSKVLLKCGNVDIRKLKPGYQIDTKRVPTSAKLIKLALASHFTIEVNAEVGLKEATAPNQ